MEELINQIVELDNHAKEKIRSIKDKEDNIETYISETLEKEKKKSSEIDDPKMKKIDDVYNHIVKDDSDKK